MPVDAAVLDRLIAESFKVKQNAYNSYSKFPVGAALLTADGTIFTGCNVENASYGITICAERNAVSKAVSEGYRDFKAIVVSSNLGNEYITPCGACRQTLVEFSLDMEVYMTKADGTYKMKTSGELLPDCFTPQRLAEYQAKE